MRRTLSIVLLLLMTSSLSGVASAQSKAEKAPPKVPNAAEVLDGYVEAIGGRKAIEKHTSMSMSGTLEVANLGLKGTIEILSKNPNKIAVTTVIDGLGTTRQAFDGQSGWTSEPLQGLRDMDAREIALVERSVFSSDVRWREVFKTVEYLGTKNIDDRWVHMLVLSPPPGAGSPTTNFYDAESGLLVRTEMILETSAATIPVVTKLTDYRKVGGVLIAMRMEQALPTATLITQFTDVRFDVKVDEAVFKKPAN